MNDSSHDLTLYNLTEGELKEILATSYPLPYKLADIIEVTEDIIGEGRQSDYVKLGVIKTTKKQVALKYFSKRKLLENVRAAERLKNEIYALSTTHHPNIIGFFGFCYEADHIVLIMEYARHGDLFDYLLSHNLTDDEIAAIFVNMIQAIEYLHLRGIVHRDIKPENFLICDGGSIKLGDFGFCKDRLTDLVTPCGSMSYAAPEVLIVDNENTYTSTADIWSLGVCLFSMTTKDNLWPAEKTRDIYRCVREGKMKKFPMGTSFLIVDLFNKMCEYDPKKRITAYEALFHPFVQPFKLCPVENAIRVTHHHLTPERPSSNKILKSKSPEISSRAPHAPVPKRSSSNKNLNPCIVDIPPLKPTQKK